MATKGKFITFEGGEGSGKSTQLRALAAWLGERGIDVVSTREPGGAPSAEIIRTLLVEGDVDRWQPVSEVLLHYAARTEHLAHTVLPALERGAWVLSDRYCDSTLAYQGYGHGFDRAVIAQIHNAAVDGLMPDLTLILDIPVEAGLMRAHGRDHDENRYERMGEGFHGRVRDGFLAIASAAPQRCAIIDATQGLEQVESDIRTVLQDRLQGDLP